MATTRHIDGPLMMALAACGWGWVTWWWLWPLGLVAYVPLVAGAARTKRLGRLVAVTSPFILVPVLSFCQGIFHWTEGRAALRRTGWASVESRNLDPQLRVPVAAPTWHLDGREPFRQLSYNAALRMLGAMGGPMKGGYTGRYPDRERAWRLLDDAAPATPGRYTWYGAPIPMLDEDADLRAVYAGETLIIGHPGQLWLVNARTRAAFATYFRPLGKPPMTRWPDGPALPPAEPARPQLNASPAW